MKNIFYILLFFGLSSCQSEGNKKEVPTTTQTETAAPKPQKPAVKIPQSEQLQVQPQNIRPEKRYVKEHNAGKFSFNIQAQNGERSKMKITTKGLETEFKDLFVLEGQVLESHLLDLNGDGFKEVYIITSLTDDSGNLEIMGITSNKDKSAGEIYIKDTKEKRKVNSDRVTVKNGKLMREFVGEDGKVKKYTYELVPDKSTMMLQAVQL